jgi:hypothetical protein
VSDSSDSGSDGRDSGDGSTTATSSDGGYVHRPGEWDGDEREDSGERGGGGGAARTASDDTTADGLGRTGWLLVGIVVLTFLVIPGVIYAFPAAPGEAGIPFLVAMLALPFLPAVILGGVAVWSAVRDRQ